MDSSIHGPNILNFRLSRPLGLTLVAVSALLVLLLDIGSGRYNLPTLYIIPLMLFAQTNRSRGIMVLGAILCVLTLGKYLGEFVPGLWGDGSAQSFFQYRLANRLLNVVALAVCALVLRRWRHFNQLWELQGAQNPQEQTGRLARHTYQAMGRIMAVTLAVVVAAAIFAIDFVTPAEINMPILYIAPLVIVGLTCSWRLTFITLAVLLTLAVVGYYLGAQPTMKIQNSAGFQLATNRSLACAGMCGAAAVMYALRRFS